MKIGIIGPSKIESLKGFKDSEKIILSLVSKLKEHEIVLTPDKGSVSEFFGLEYVKNEGKKIYSVIPLDDKEFGYSWVNTKLGKNINCQTWRNQPEKLNEESDCLLCIGYSTGGLIEICYSKWFNKKPVYIINELVSGKLPKELEKNLDLRYVSYKDLKIN